MSDAEAKVLDQLEQAGLADGLRTQYRFADRLGRRWQFDFAWPGAMLAVEVEGGAYILGRHVRGAGFEADATKYNYAALIGWRVLRFGPKAVSSKLNVIPRYVALYLGRHTITPGAWAAQLASVVADSPKPPKPKKRKPAAQREAV